MGVLAVRAPNLMTPYALKANKGYLGDISTFYDKPCLDLILSGSESETKRELEKLFS